MSTCQGAPAPHDDCRAGDLCDWEGRPGRAEEIMRAKSELRDLIEAQGWLPGGPYVPNRADRRRAARMRVR